MEIVVIGTEPPCIRCHTTYKRTRDVAGQFSEDIRVKKIAIHTEEAAKYGKIESGHGIREASNVKPDSEKMDKLRRELEELKTDEANNENHTLWVFRRTHQSAQSSAELWYHFYSTRFFQ